MITEFILDLLKQLTIYVVNLFPTVELGAEFQNRIPNFMSWFCDIVSAASYVLPVSDMLVMFGLWCTIKFTILNWKIIQRVWDALPFT